MKKNSGTKARAQRMADKYSSIARKAWAGGSSKKSGTTGAKRRATKARAQKLADRFSAQARKAWGSSSGGRKS